MRIAHPSKPHGINEVEWKSKIVALKKLISEVGPLWPDSTRLAGYGENGPYHCGDCIWLVESTHCSHPVVKADPQMHKDDLGKPLVSAAKGCCEFVEPH